MAHGSLLFRHARRLVVTLVALCTVLAALSPASAQTGTIADLASVDPTWTPALDESGPLGDVMASFGGSQGFGAGQINDANADLSVWVRGFDESVGVLRVVLGDAEQAADFRDGVVDGAGGAAGGCMQVPADVDLVCSSVSTVVTWQSDRVVDVVFGSNQSAISDLVVAQSQLDPPTTSPSGLSAYDAGRLVGQLMLGSIVIGAIVSAVRRRSGGGRPNEESSAGFPQPAVSVPPAPGWPSAQPVEPPRNR